MVREREPECNDSVGKRVVLDVTVGTPGIWLAMLGYYASRIRTRGARGICVHGSARYIDIHACLSLSLVQIYP